MPDIRTPEIGDIYKHRQYTSITGSIHELEHSWCKLKTDRGIIRMDLVQLDVHYEFTGRNGLSDKAIEEITAGR